MESPQQGKAGTRKSASGSAGSGSAKGKMKRCSYCGAKNKASFEYCIRCSEPLDVEAPAAAVASESGALPKLLAVGVGAVVLLVAAALLFRGSPDNAGSGGAPTVQASGAANVAPRPVSVEPGIGSKEVLGTFN